MHHPSVSRHNSSVIILLNIIYLGQRKSPKVQILRFLSAPVKFTKFLMSFMKTHFCHFSFKVCINLQYNDNSFVISNILYFGQKGPIKGQILKLSSVGSKLAKFLMSYFKAQVSSSLRFVLFCIILHYSSNIVYFRQK